MDEIVGGELVTGVKWSGAKLSGDEIAGGEVSYNPPNSPKSGVSDNILAPDLAEICFLFTSFQKKNSLCFGRGKALI